MKKLDEQTFNDFMFKANKDFQESLEKDKIVTNEECRTDPFCRKISLIVAIDVILDILSRWIS